MLTKSIEQLENDYWKAIEFPTGLVERCYNYRKIPIENLTAGQIRTLISQQMGLQFLIPLTLELLKENVLMDAELYEGDLLEAVLKVKPPFWNQYPALKTTLVHLLKAHRQRIGQSDAAKFCNQFLNSNVAGL